MTRLMYDSTNIQDDPAAAHMVAYYVDGIYAVSAATVRARFPSAMLVPISAVGTDNGIVGDVEPGCIALGACVRWVQMRRLANADPTLYVNETYGWGPVRTAFHAAGVPEPHWWVANYDGIPVIPAGAVAKQYANPTLTHGHFDLSVVADYWPGVDGQGDDMTPAQEQLLTDTHNKVNELWATVTNGGKVYVDAGNPHWLVDQFGAINKANADQTAAIVAAIRAIPAPVIDAAALAAAIAPLLPAQSKPPVASQAVKDWWAQLTHWLGLS
jgi:hypothetical protein